VADIDIVVTNYRTPRDLGVFVSSLYNNSPEVDYSLRIIDVDPEHFGQLGVLGKLVPEDTLVKVFRDNVGYGYASNYGANAMGTSAPIIGIFNADVAFPKGQLAEIVAAMQAHPGWSIVGPRQLSSDGLITHSGIVGTNQRPEFRSWREPAQGMWTDTVDCVTIMGAAFFVRRAVWEEMSVCQNYREFLAQSGLPDSPDSPGAFLPTPLYFEETWCAYHARAHGHRVVYFGGATLLHEWHNSIRENLTAAQEGDIINRSRSFFDAACDHHGIEHP
jgi:GT2 family glycosyltransferase